MKKILPVIVIIAVAIGGFLYFKKRGSEKIEYRKATVMRADLNITILTTGTVAPENRLEIKPPIAGRVEQIMVVEGQNVKKGQLLAWMSSTERAALLDAASSSGPGELKRWEEFYKPAPILAPIDGSVIARNVEPGQSFTTNDPIFVLSDRLTVKAQVDETDISSVRLKQAAEITLDAYPKQIFPAHVDQIAFDATTVNNVTTYVVDVLPQNTPEFMRSGMTANVNLLVEARPQALTLPIEAVQRKEGRTSVLVEAKKGPPQSKDIKTGVNDGRSIEILEGLQEGDVVLIAQKKATNRNSQNTNPLSPVRGRGGSR